jgi:hypothetical protein
MNRQCGSRIRTLATPAPDAAESALGRSCCSGFDRGGRAWYSPRLAGPGTACRCVGPIAIVSAIRVSVSYPAEGGTSVRYRHTLTGFLPSLL